MRYSASDTSGAFLPPHPACGRNSASLTRGTTRGVRLALTEGTVSGQLPGPGAHTSVHVRCRASGSPAQDTQVTPGARGARRLPPRRVPPLRRPWAQPVARWPWAGCPQGLDGGFCGRTAQRSCSTRRPRRCWLWRPLSRTHREARGPGGQRAHRGRSAAPTSRPGHARPAVRQCHHGLVLPCLLTSAG